MSPKTDARLAAVLILFCGWMGSTAVSLIIIAGKL